MRQSVGLAIGQFMRLHSDRGCVLTKASTRSAVQRHNCYFCLIRREISNRITREILLLQIEYYR